MSKVILRCRHVTCHSLSLLNGSFQWKVVRTWLGRGNIAAVSLKQSRSKFSHSDNQTVLKELADGFHLIYEGPLSKSVSYVKVFSLTTCLAAMIGSPCLVFLGKESVPLIGKVAVAGTVALFGTTTTFLLHWVTRVYVHRLFFNPMEKTFTAETMSIFARRKLTQFSVRDINIPSEESAFSTFVAKDKKYFIHMELPEAQQVMNYVKEYHLLQDAAPM